MKLDAKKAAFAALWSAFLPLDIFGLSEFQNLVMPPINKHTEQTPGLETFHTSPGYRKERAFAKLSEASYNLNLCERTPVETELGVFTPDEEFTHDRYQVYTNADTAVLVFRGTEFENRYQEDVWDADKAIAENYFKFMGESAHMRTQEANEISHRFTAKYGDSKKCEVSGHSLGGTLALHAVIHNKDLNNGVVFNPGAAPIMKGTLDPKRRDTVKSWQQKTADVTVIRTYGDFVSWYNLLGRIIQFANPFHVAVMNQPAWCKLAKNENFMVEHQMTNFTQFDHSKVPKVDAVQKFIGEVLKDPFLGSFAAKTLKIPRPVLAVLKEGNCAHLY